MLIIFEGIEGVGKTTHLNLLASRLKEQGFPVVASTKEPGWGEDHLSGILKHLIEQPLITPIEKLFFLLADRAGHYKRFIRPLLNERHCRPIVLCERGPDSTLAYQGFGMNILRPELLNALNLAATEGILSNLTVVLDADPAISLARSTKKEKFDLANQNLRTFYETIRQGFYNIAKMGSDRYVVVNTATTVEQASEEIWRIVRTKLNL